jgi:hypothetical protein
MPYIDLTGDVRPGAEFRLTVKPWNAAPATFVAVTSTEIRVARRLVSLFDLPDATPVVAHWHGQYRTDGFALSVGELRALAAQKKPDLPLKRRGNRLEGQSDLLLPDSSRRVATIAR